MLTQKALLESKAERIAPLKVLNRERNNEASREELLVNEIYRSLQGEGTHSGLACWFVRLTGCHLRCRYCDSEHSFYKGQIVNIQDILKRLDLAKARYVQLTGGEPLLQKSVFRLMTELSNEGFQVLLETSGTVSTARVDPRVISIIDLKTPSSGESSRNHFENYRRLRTHDEIKAVIETREDFDYTLNVVRTQQIKPSQVLISPSYGRIELPRLAEWILESSLPLRLQTQLHKTIWGEKQGV